jgi:alpha-N-arabinofuranosidase
VALRMRLEGPGYAVKSGPAVSYVDASAIHGPGRLVVFLVNRHPTQAAPVIVELANGRLAGLQSGELFSGPGPKAANTYEQPDVVCSRAFTEVSFLAGNGSLSLPPLSVAALSLRVE